MVEQFAAKLPNAMTEQELIDGGKSPEEARHIMHQRVFGADFKTDADGKPVEKGKGSALQPTPQHVEALARENARNAMVAGHGNSKVISEAVAAGVKAGLQEGRKEAEL